MQSPADHNHLMTASAAALTGDENLLILAPNPLDESLCCGGLIAERCRRGRPPYVMVLTDGSTTGPLAKTPQVQAATHERETRAAVEKLGLPESRLLMVGLFDGAIPLEGPVFDAITRAVTLVMWARDCNLLVAPWPHNPAAHHHAAAQIAKKVAAGSGVGLLFYQLPGALPESTEAFRLDITPDLAAKNSAIAEHAAMATESSQSPYEIFLRPQRRF